MPYRLVTCLLVSSFALAAVPARRVQAQESEWQQAEDSGVLGAGKSSARMERQQNRALWEQRGGFWAGLSFYRSSSDVGSTTGLSPLFGVRYDFRDALRVEAEYGVAGTVYSMGGMTTSPFRSGNPYLGVLWVHHADAYDLRLGGGVAIPLASLPDPSSGSVQLAMETYALAWGMRGGRGAWLWWPSTLGLVPSARIDGLTGKLAWGGTLTGAVLVPTDRGRTTGLVIELTGRAGYRPSPGFETGLGLSGVAILGGSDPTASGLARDRFQSSANLYVRAGFQAGWVDVRLVMNLDRPFGFAFDEGRIWAVDARFGIAIP